MDENSWIYSALKKGIAKYLKKDNVTLFLVIVILFKAEFLSFTDTFLDKLRGGLNSSVTQDIVMEKKMDQAVIDAAALEELKKMRESYESLTKLHTPQKSNEHIVYCGINDADIGNWELSVTPENSLGLKDGDKVAVRNKDYDVHLQSAVFFVKMFRKNNPNDPDFYMTEDTARCLGIEDAKKRGRFTVSLQLFDNR